MNKLLLAGGGHADIPLIRAARRLGWHVTTSGNRPGDLGHAEADAYEPADFSDPAAMLALARRIGAGAVVACCNDFSALACAFVATELGLPGHDPLETSEIIHHKDRWRAFAAAHGVPSPRAEGFDSEAAAEAGLARFRFPVMVKPVDLTGGKGMARVDDLPAARAAIRRAMEASRAKRLVVEEFIEGSRHGFTAILRAGKVAFHFSDDEHYHLSPYLVSAASAPTSSPPSTAAFLAAESERIAAILGLSDGIFHVQYIEGPAGPVIIEICRRAPGDLYVELVRHATGVPYPEWIIRPALGLPLDEVAPRPVSRSLTRHCLMADRPGVFRGFRWDPAVEARIVDRMVWGKPGDPVADPLLHKFGIVFVEHQDPAAMRAEAPRLQALLRCEVG